MILKHAVSALTHDRCDFRGASWGMSKTEVKYTEGLVPNSEGEGYITYNERVMDLDAVVAFHFVGDNLVEAGYAFREPIGDERLYRYEYEKVKGIITCSYGRPSFDEEACDDECECYMDCDARPDEASDPLIYLSEWQTGRSIIRLILMGEGGGFDFGVLHSSREYAPLIERRMMNSEAGN
jgi:hypothetical protein